MNQQPIQSNMASQDADLDALIASIDAITHAPIVPLTPAEIEADAMAAIERMFAHLGRIFGITIPPLPASVNDNAKLKADLKELAETFDDMTLVPSLHDEPTSLQLQSRTSAW